MVEQGSSCQGETRANVHRIANHPIRSDINQPAGRIEWRGRTAPNKTEREDAPKRQKRTGPSDDHACDLRGTHTPGTNDSGPRENAAG